VPLWLLYEAGILVAAMLVKPRVESGSDFQPLSETEMDAELDRIESENGGQK
jgi:sec-independent protein translocase protein TatC